MDRRPKDTNDLKKRRKPESETRIGIRPQDLYIQIRNQGERAKEIVNEHKGLDEKTKKNLQAFITDIQEQADKDLPKARESAPIRFTQMQEERTQALHRIQGRALQVQEILSLLRADNSEAIKSYLAEAMRSQTKAIGDQAQE